MWKIAEGMREGKIVKSKSSLAINGGTPVRTKPFPSWPQVDEREYEAVKEVLDNRTWNQTVGAVTLEFEKRFAGYHEAKEAISATSGFDAIQIALRALGIGAGDEVVMPAHTCAANPVSTMQVNAVPVFADIERENHCLDPVEFEKKITERTKAVMPVHFGGNMANMREVKKIAVNKGLFVIEDAALAQGATRDGRSVGSWGDLTIYSFGDDKPMTAGRGGMISTNSEPLADRCRALRDRGRKSYEFYAEFVEELGWNYRLSELLAAVLLVQFEKYPSHIALEEKNIRYLFDRLKEVKGIRMVNQLLPGERNVIDIVMLAYDRGEIDIEKGVFVDALNAEGIPSFKGYDYSLNEHPIMKSTLIQRCPVGCPYYGNKMDYSAERFPVTMEACRSSVWLWHYAVLLGNEKDMDDVFSAIKKIADNQEELAATSPRLGSQSSPPAPEQCPVA